MSEFHRSARRESQWNEIWRVSIVQQEDAGSRVQVWDFYPTSFECGACLRWAAGVIGFGRRCVSMKVGGATMDSVIRKLSYGDRVTVRNFDELVRDVSPSETDS
jgi:hypothetical protein